MFIITSSKLLSMQESRDAQIQHQCKVWRIRWASDFSLVKVVRVLSQSIVTCNLTGTIILYSVVQRSQIVKKTRRRRRRKRWRRRKWRRARYVYIQTFRRCHALPRRCPLGLVGPLVALEGHWRWKADWNYWFAFFSASGFKLFIFIIFIIRQLR